MIYLKYVVPIEISKTNPQGAIMNNKDEINKKKQLMRTTAIGIGIAGLVWDTIVNQPMNLTSLILYFIALGLFAFSFVYKRKN